MSDLTLNGALKLWGSMANGGEPPEEYKRWNALKGKNIGYIKPITWSELSKQLDHTPKEIVDLYGQFNKQKKTVRIPYGDGHLVARPNTSLRRENNDPLISYYFNNKEAHRAVGEDLQSVQDIITTFQTLGGVAGALAGAKSQPTYRIRADGSKHKLTDGGKTFLQQRSLNKYKKQYERETAGMDAKNVTPNQSQVSTTPVKAQIPKYAQNAKIPMPELAKQQRVEHAFQFSMKDTYGLPDVTTSTGKLASKLDSIKYHYDNKNLLNTSQRAVLDEVLDTFQSKDLRGFKAVVGTTVDESVTAGQRAYGKITVDPGPSTPHHGGGIDQTATPQLRFGDKGVLLRNQLNIDYGIPTADDPLNYYGVYDVATRGLRQAKLDSLAPLYDKITKNKPTNIKKFTGITLNDAFGSSDIAFGKPGGKVTPGTYPIIRGINNEDILRTQNNIKPGSPITDRIWRNRWNYIADYYGISKNVFRKFNKNPEISPDDITVSADHITIHDLIDAGKELKGTALHEVERLGGNVQDLTKPQAWEKLDTYKAGAILGESIAESHAIALGVLMKKVEIIRQDPILKQLWNETKVDDIPMLMEQLKTEFAGKGWFEFISKNKSKWVESILEGDLLKNYNPTDLKKIQKGFKLQVPKKLWQKDFRQALHEVWSEPDLDFHRRSESKAILKDIESDL